YSLINIPVHRSRKSSRHETNETLCHRSRTTPTSLNTMLYNTFTHQNLPDPSQITQNIIHINTQTIKKFLNSSTSTLEKLATIRHKIGKQQKIIVYTDGSLNTEKKMGFGWHIPQN